MKYLLTGKQMKAVDQYSIQEAGIPSVVLMERAAMAVTEEITAYVSKETPVLIAAGVGNNGADGLAIARMLAHKGYRDVEVFVAGKEEKATKEWNCQKKILEFLKIPVFFVQEEQKPEYNDRNRDFAIVDALFGIGLTREITGNFAELISYINSAKAWKVAVDIASGISSDTGKVMGCAVKADMTVTFGYEKLGQIFYPGAEYSGMVKVKDIGFPHAAIEFITDKTITYTKEDLALLPHRPACANKGTFGKVLVIAGAKNMAGAAYFAASAAYAAGAGLVRILTTEENRQILQQLIPEAVMTVYDASDIDFTIVDECLAYADVVAMGPGMSVAEYACGLMKYVLEHRTAPMILDADAINVIAKNPEWCYDKKDNLIWTPHLLEFSRVSKKTKKELSENLKTSAEEFAKENGGVLVCKDARTIVAQKGSETYINTSGNCGMAKGGSGDVLTGIIAGLLAGGCTMLTAARLGVYIHGLAGDRAAKLFGKYSMKASDLVKALSDVLKEG